NVYVSRYFDGNIIGDELSDAYDLSDNSVWAEDFFAISLGALTYGTFHFVRVERFSDWVPPTGRAVACEAGPAFIPTLTNRETNYVGRITYAVGNVSPNQSKTVKVVY